MYNRRSSRFSRASAQKPRQHRTVVTPPSPSPDRVIVPPMAQKAEGVVWSKARSPATKTALIGSLILHVLLGFYFTTLMPERQLADAQPIRVEWVPPPPVKLKVRPREIPKQVPNKVVQSKQKSPAALMTKVAKRSSHKVSEVIVKGPEVVRESVEIQRDAPISRILPTVTTASQFEAEADSREAIAPPTATPRMIAAPGAGIVTNRVRAAGDGETQGLSDVDSYGTSLRGATGSGDGLGDGFEDIGTTPPRVIQIDQTADGQANDLFGIGEYVEETRGEDRQEVVYVLDVSSSMTGTKLRLAVQALKDALSMLYQGDSFSIVTFDRDVHIYSESMIPFSRENLNRAHQYLDALRPRSGTNLWGGLERGLALESSTVVLISDGDPSRGVTDRRKIVALTRKLNTSNARIMTISLGAGHSDDGVLLLKQLADEHGGQLLMIELGS